MDQLIKPLFVYGSLRSEYNHAAHAYISQYFSLAGQGMVQGKLYDLGSYPGAIPTTGEDTIVGALYEIKDNRYFTHAMQLLDDYEGVNPSEDEPAIFKRELTKVYLHNGNMFEAYIYWFAGIITNQPLIESGDITVFLDQKRKQ